MKARILSLFLVATLVFVLVSCAGQPPTSPPTPVPALTPDPAIDYQLQDRIVSLGPSITEVLVELGAGERIIAADEHSVDVPGLPADIPLFPAFGLDPEQLIILQPDIVFVTGMMRGGGDDPFRVLESAGINVVDVPISQSIAEISREIRFIAEVVGEREQAEAIVADMEAHLGAIREAIAPISYHPRVFFEIEAAPFLFTFGGDVFLNELVELAGGVNIFAAEQGWIAASDEAVVSINPEVILTNVGWLDDPVGEILARPGWAGVAAIESGRVYYIDANASSRPSHNIVLAAGQIAEALHPGVREQWLWELVQPSVSPEAP